jgi:hypothetical protein
LQRPSRKGQKSFTRSRGQDEPAISYVLESRERFDSQDIGGWMRNHAGFSAQVDTGDIESILVRSEPMITMVIGASPYLTAGFCILVDEANFGAMFCCGRRCRHSCRARAHNHNIKSRHPVTTSMPCCTVTWHVRTCGMPFTIAQHSMHIPMAQSGPRGSPETEVRNAIPACNSAAATFKPDGTETRRPLTVRSTAGFASCAKTGCVIVERR